MRMERILLYITGASALCAVSTLAKIQYHFVYELKSWTDAQSYCRNSFTDLVTVDNAEIMTMLNNMVDWNQMGSQTDAWIGFYDDVNSWRWSLSDSAFYQNYGTFYRRWSLGQPDNAGGRETCLEMLGNGDWNDIYCGELRKALCSTVSGQTATFTVSSSLLTWAQAQSYCRSHHTDLASVRSDAENNQLITAKPAGETVWLGLFRDGWKWSNGSQAAFTYWNTGEPNGPSQNCAAANIKASGFWVDWECPVTKVFICYHEVPFTNHVVKLKLQGISSVDLQDAAVQEHLLSELKQELRNCGVTADIRLSWRRQPDGNIFYQEKDDHN